ncbi:MAG: transposase [Prosthecobacter sp.]|uniref:transposase n=1 Tax=Prosthecobacter sp. TaxID=1965333 RepID=UPI003903900E
MLWLVPENIPLPSEFKGFKPDSPLTHDFDAYERHMPHWRVLGCCYFTTFRLRDSVPPEIWAEMKAAAKVWAKRLAVGTLRAEEWAAWQDFQQTQLRKLELVLDEGRGECLLRQPEHREVIVAALHHFEGTRCEMLAYAIMPNHVHVLCRPLGQHALESLTRSWKRHSSDRIHRRLGRSGSFWQEESFDRVVRDAEHYRRVVRYIAMNPAKAGLKPADATVWMHPKIVEANAGT